MEPSPVGRRLAGGHAVVGSRGCDPVVWGVAVAGVAIVSFLRGLSRCGSDRSVSSIRVSGSKRRRVVATVVPKWVVTTVTERRVDTLLVRSAGRRRRVAIGISSGVTPSSFGVGRRRRR